MVVGVWIFRIERRLFSGDCGLIVVSCKWLEAVTKQADYMAEQVVVLCNLCFNRVCVCYVLLAGWLAKCTGIDLTAAQKLHAAHVSR